MLAGTNPLQPGNPDLHRVQKAVWGKLGYMPSPEDQLSRMINVCGKLCNPCFSVFEEEQQ